MINMTVFANFYKSINSAVVFCAVGAKSLGFYELKKLIKGLKFKFVNHFHCKFLLKNSENRKNFRLRRKFFWPAFGRPSVSLPGRRVTNKSVTRGGV